MPQIRPPAPKGELGGRLLFGVSGNWLMCVVL